MRTAGELFWSHGYARTGVSLIIERARATSGSFYHFFPTKEDLLLAVLDAAGESLEHEALAPAEQAGAAPADRIDRLADAYRRRPGSESPSFGLPVGSLAGELGGDHVEAQRRLAALFEAVVSRVEAWLEDGGNALSAAPDRRRFAELVVASLEGAATMARVGGPADAVEHVAAELRQRLAPDGHTAPNRFDRRPQPARRDSGALDWRAW